MKHKVCAICKQITTGTKVDHFMTMCVAPCPLGCQVRTTLTLNSLNCLLLLPSLSFD